jgi:hypothetical protein
MFALHGRAAKLCDNISRRELLRIGGLSAMGLSLPSLLQARDELPAGILPTDKTFGRARNVIFLWLQGGPPQHETFDPKPNAPREIRGAFQPIQTNVPDIHFCELLPRIARMADKLAVVRSMSTDDNIHSSSGYWVLTGRKYVGPNARTIQPTDWPYFGSIVKMVKPSETLPPLSTVWVPDILRLNESVTPAGQTAGILGGQWHPERFVGDPSLPDYKVQGLRLTEIPPLKLRERQSLLQQVEQHFHNVERGDAVGNYDKFQQQAFDLLTSGKAQKAFAIQNEPVKIRERYGRHTWGQCVLLARRLVEAGVRMVHVNWCREPGDNASDNPMWDTHAQNADRVEDVLCPKFDVGFTALIEDLEQRGLLGETLVVAIAEFGRTPKINAKAGRDHWGPVFSFALAGAGISGGQVYGASDKNGAYPARDRVQPGELTATLFHLLGINWNGTFRDREGQFHNLTDQQPLFKLLGTEPATFNRVISDGDIARVPPFDGSLLFNSAFEDSVPLKPFTGPARPKGWRGEPLLEPDANYGFGVKLSGGNRKGLLSGKPRVEIGFTNDSTTLNIGSGSKAVLAQEVRSPFPGKYVLKLKANGGGSSRKVYEEVFLKNFTCKLMFFQYTHMEKSPQQRTELASISFQPLFSSSTDEGWKEFSLSKNFVNPKAGSNFSFGLGLGVAVVVEKKSPGSLMLDENESAFIRIDELQLDFAGKQRNDKVTV